MYIYIYIYRNIRIQGAAEKQSFTVSVQILQTAFIFVLFCIFPPINNYNLLEQEFYITVCHVLLQMACTRYMGEEDELEMEGERGITLHQLHEIIQQRKKERRSKQLSSEMKIKRKKIEIASQEEETCEMQCSEQDRNEDQHSDDEGEENDDCKDESMSDDCKDESMSDDDSENEENMEEDDMEKSEDDEDVEEEDEEDEDEVKQKQCYDDALPIVTQQKANKKTVSVNYHLPDWVTKYYSIEDDIQSNSKPLHTFNIPHAIKNNLQSIGVQHLFPVQVHVVPELLNSIDGPLLTQSNGVAPSDLCVCAPTGCGKTLSYVIPITSALLRTVTCHLRALVVLPSQDLALQVRDVFENVSKGTKVKVGVLCGQKSLDEELERVVIPLGSKVDILVSTPGRLVSHLQRSGDLLLLTHLRYLVIDEADRMFEQHFQGWLEYVLEAVQYTSPHHTPLSALYSTSFLPFLFPSMQMPLFKHRHITPPHISTPKSHPTLNTLNVLQPQSSLQKLLFSATLSFDPEQLSILQLHRPKLYTVSPATKEHVGQSVLPSTLTERMITCKPDYKPLVLLYILFSMDHKHVLCFTHSKVSTHHLTLLLKQYGANVDEISMSSSQEARKAAITKFISGKLQV